MSNITLLPHQSDVINQTKDMNKVAKLLRVNKNFVYRLINNGELEAVRIGSIKVREEVLNQYVSEQTYNARKEKNTSV